jgi:iron(III) transport system permease protein
MSSCLWLERPAAWRSIAIAILFTLVTAPAWPLGWHAFTGSGPSDLGEPFWTAMRNSLEIAISVVVLALAIGLPAGLVVALYEFPGRRLFLAAVTIPLLAPSFLWAIGWSVLAGHVGPTATVWMNGRLGCCLVFLSSAVPLVLWITYAATMSLAGTQVEAARMAGGERTVIQYAGRYVAVTAMLAAVLAGILTLSDPGPGQILGRRTAASEVLTSFSSLYDYGLAAWQCIVLTFAVLALVAPLVILVAGRLSSQILARQVHPLQRIPAGRLAPAISAAFVGIAFLLLVGPLSGLLLPLGRGVDLTRAWREVVRTGPNTLIYAVGTGVMAAVLGFVAALCVGRSSRARAVVLGACLALFTLPPSLGALGVVETAAWVPPWLDWLTRSRLTLCVEMGLRFFPIATIITLRSWGSLSSTWTQAAALHGVPTTKYFARVVVPHMLPALAAALLLVGLLATADVGSVLLLHPPGQGSLPLAIFTVMANAPESLVASLCLVYVALAFGIVSLLWLKTRSDQP